MQPMMSPKRLAIFAGYAALGPITGPCVAGFVRNMRAGAPILACLYLVTLGFAWLDLALFTAWTAGRAFGG